MTYASGVITRVFKFKLGNFEEVKPEPNTALELTYTVSIFDKVCAECPAQYASAKEPPSKKLGRCEDKVGRSRYNSKSIM